MSTTTTTTPMLKQYQAIKSKHKDCILFFRLGDFYEMFYDDAKIGSRVLDLVLTSRGKGASGKIPMCGIPYHAAENYITRLIKAGHKVAICEQVENPALAKGIVKRDVIRIITSGTYLDETSSDPRYVISLSPNANSIGMAFTDPTSGTIQTNQYSSKTYINGKEEIANPKYLFELIAKLPIFECIYPSSEEDKIKNLFNHPLIKSKEIILSPFEDWCFNHDIAKKSLCEHFSVHNLNGFGIEAMHCAISSTGALLEYLKQMNKQPLRHIDKVSVYADDNHLFISPAAYKGLELENLVKTIDFTLTPMGKRKFRFTLYHPLKEPSSILSRQQAVKILKESDKIKDNLNFYLNKIPDIEKNISRLSCGYIHAKDLLSIRNTLSLLPDIIDIVKPLTEKNSLFYIENIPELREYLERSINENVSLSHPEGNTIKEGFHQELDSLREIQNSGRLWLKKFQEEEIKRTGINSLKVGFNKVFGYYIEVTKSNLSSVPKDYIRKQTLINGERFITPELKEYEEKILNAEDKILKIENDLVKEISKNILDNAKALHQFCQSIATIDFIYSLSVLAKTPGYIAPEITDSSVIDIKEGRHPVVEKTLNEDFTPNDTFLDCIENHLIILTGPNMAGKSTYIRQTAILVIMAQIGSYIPAQSATIGIVDKVFTRIGAHDDITKGQSTFMVEMNEAADILNNLTDKSLIILDEIGRGTSTYDGLSLAWALAEHLHKTKARTLFATHFHELTALAEEHLGIKNYNVAVKEWKDEIVFLHKIIPGGTDDSYGIYVAKLAGIPSKVISRAKQILTQLELKGDIKESLKTNYPHEEQLSLFSQGSDPNMEEIKEILENIDLNNLTPIEAFKKLQEMKETLEKE